MNTDRKREPQVAVVGRPNVGKSTLFNRLVGRRIAVVHRESGTTRDRIYGTVDWDNSRFELVDTGGILPRSPEQMDTKIFHQVSRAFRQAELCLLVVDVEEGLNPLDREIASFLRKEGKAVIVVVNKADNPNLELGESEFTALGFNDMVALSAAHGLGVNSLLDMILEKIPRVIPAHEENRTALAIVGRPNSGKSTLINHLTGSDRVVVDDVPGTTRDAVDIPFQWRGKQFQLIDTAGLLRRMDSRSALDFFSLTRTQRGIGRADAVILLLETPREPTRVDANFIKLILSRGKGCLLGVNKWDLRGDLTEKEYRQAVSRKLAFAGFIPLVFCSALTGTGIDNLMETASYVIRQRDLKIDTAPLNRVLQEAQDRVSPPRRKGKKLRIFYGVQVGTAPPVFHLFVNDTRCLNTNYEQYLKNCLRRSFGFEGVPLRISLRKRT